MIHGLALLIPLNFRDDREVAGSVLPCGEGGGGGEKAELGGELRGVDFKKRSFADRGGEFHLKRGDDLHVSALCLDIEGADLTGRKVATGGGHGLLEGE